MEIKQWEYYVETMGSILKSVKDEELVALLNELGEAGWEVFSVENPDGGNKVRVTAKRTLQKTTPKQHGWP